MKSTMLHSASPDLYGYLPSRQASSSIGWYQIILLVDRGTCVLTACPGLHSTAGRLEFEPSTIQSQVRHPITGRGGGRIVRGMKLCVVRVTGTVRRASKDCVNWALLNPATEEMRTQAKTVADLSFTGDLAYETGPYRPETEEGEVVSVHCRR